MAAPTDKTVQVQVEITSTGTAAAQKSLDLLAKFGIEAQKTQRSMNALAIQNQKTATSLNTVGNNAQAAGQKMGKMPIGALGVQFGDFVGQVASGGNAVIAFGQQLSQVQQQIAVTSQGAKGLAGFIGGPWGTLISAGVFVLGPLIEKLLETKKATDEVIKSTRELAQEYRNLGATQQAQADIELNKLRDRRLELENYISRQPLNSATGQPMFSYSQQKELQSVRLQILQQEKLRELATDLATAEGKKAAATDKSTAATTRSTNAARENKNALEDQKKAWDGTFKSLSDYFGQLNDGNPEIARIQQNIDKLNAALASQKLSAEGTAEATRQLTQAHKDLATAQEKIALQDDPFGQYILSTNELIRKTAELKTELEAVNGLLEKGNLDKNQRGLLEGYKKQITDELDPEGKTVRDRADLYAKGGKYGGEDAGRLAKQIEEQQKVIDQLNEIGASTRAATADMEKMKLEMERLKLPPAVRETLDEIGDAFNELVDNIDDVILGTKKLGKVMEDFAKKTIAALTKLIVKYALFKAVSAISGSLGGQVGGFLGFAKGGVIQHGKQLQEFAKGAAFLNGHVKKFATGGILTQPTIFPMGNGSAIAGEAGPEAIMPLARTSSGKLGVQAVAPVININNYAGVAVSTSTGPDGTLDIELRAIEGARKAVAQDIRRGGNMVSRSLETTYGVGRGR